MLAAWGDVDAPLLYRSAIKPIQAYVSQRNGAGLLPEQMALACSSHDATPVQLAIVRDMLESAGLEESDLRCPASPPGSFRRRLQLARRHGPERRRLYHTCSGKHAAFLRACVAQGWPTASYLEPDHPLQQEIMEEIGEATGTPTDPLAIDGCGAPVPAGTLTGLATAFARVTVDPRYTEQHTAMVTYPALLSTNVRQEGRIGPWFGGPLKRGAEGVIAAARQGVGLAVKSTDGSSRIAAIALVDLMQQWGLLPDAARRALSDVAAPAVLGGGVPVGTVEAALDR